MKSSLESSGASSQSIASLHDLILSVFSPNKPSSPLVSKMFHCSGSPSPIFLSPFCSPIQVSEWPSPMLSPQLFVLLSVPVLFLKISFLLNLLPLFKQLPSFFFPCFFFPSISSFQNFIPKHCYLNVWILLQINFWFSNSVNEGRALSLF